MQVDYPDGPDAPPVCCSADVMAKYALGEHAAEHMRLSSKERRQRLTGGRSETPDGGPLHLYKYRSLDVNDQVSINKTRSILVQDRIWAASPASLNDPNDLRFKLVFNRDLGARKRWAKDNGHLLPRMSPADRLLRQQQLSRMTMTPEMAAGFRRDVGRDMGIFSASTDPRSRLMWTHYADEHRGICIQLASYEDELFLIAKKVIYNNTFPTLVVPTPIGGQQEHYLHKSSDWAYEKEWRVVLPLNDCCIVLRPTAISAVIIGARVKPCTVETIMTLLHERERLGKPSLKVYQAQLDDESFDISIRSWRNRSAHR